MSLFGQAKRHAPPKPRRSPLPVFAGDSEKFGLSSPTTSVSLTASRWYTVVIVPVPSLPFLGSSNSTPTTPFGMSKTSYGHHHRPSRRFVRVPLPIPPRLFARISRLQPLVKLALGIIVLVGIIVLSLGFRKRADGRNTWSPPFADPNTLVLTPEEVAKVWEWEVLSGHHPSLSEVPESVPIQASLANPVVASTLLSTQATGPIVAYQQRTPGGAKHPLVGKGPTRKYLSDHEQPLSNPAFPPRPVPGAIMDLDMIVERCDFGANKYVRDCLELLRVGGRLDNGKRVRRGNYLSSFRQLYVEAPFTPAPNNQWTPVPASTAERKEGLSRAPLTLSPPNSVTPSFQSLADPCDANHPRLFHMFWAGPFTDKPYMAVMSFLFTQNLGLDKAMEDASRIVGQTCPPQFWVWINPGPAAAVPNPDAKREMFEQLATNPWSAPFLHERFRDVVKFKMWNTTEQLDGIDELRPYWRDMSIFNSGGNVYKQQKQQAQTTTATTEEPKLGEMLEEQAEEATATAATKKKGGLFEKVGSQSESDYDRLSVILSDMARFVLTHRYGGIYLDADTIFLRDWEELWNYRGQFAYRWSWHQKYNTAVLKLHKGSALSTFLFKTALENGLDFHPMTVTRYLKDAGLDKLLLRLPDAMFDPAWLNMERYQRDRPPFPYFPEFSVFFSNDKFETAGPEQLGFEGFFRGSFSYHFHNFWWLPFDPSRNWPDLGQRFAKGENTLRDAIRQAANAKTNDETAGSTQRDDMDDETDLSWSTVLKRTFEAYLRGEQPNMYGEWIKW